MTLINPIFSEWKSVGLELAVCADWSERELQCYNVSDLMFVTEI